LDIAMARIFFGIWTPYLAPVLLGTKLHPTVLFTAYFKVVDFPLLM